ncbi:bifunctional nuclease domain-containing protein [Propionibacterium australiense]|uniref:Bifunctional nuclease domain n=1 Tax=Propionibacterium australiense TaxID=119981 RepID=A0A383S948_9ACTN|nr:bifunctional nuclease domain-containing protein [Propionibacterium australiense]RLP06873.1 hypothetical protein D9T14_11125 [Propionibacterium australiense]RLP08857.1 hypothetical protein D7U36_08515 [Propionibacterium australiense]SYZ34333.1 Bifunctional nuclease domain [Propionibacterium australiense]VEH90073.1 Uncharacterised ACR, COG1259 [Propionibacterium australiense]
MVTLSIVGVQLMESSEQPVLMLGQAWTSRFLLVWVDAQVAAALFAAADPDSRDDPSLRTYELFAQALAVTGEHELTGRVTGWSDGVFSAELVIDGAPVPGRLSDIAVLSHTMGFPLECPDELMTQLAVEAFEGDSDVIEEFKNFLDKVEADDFGEDSP